MTSDTIELSFHFISLPFHFSIKGRSKKLYLFDKKNVYNVDEVRGLISHILNKKLRGMQLNLVEVVRLKAI